MSFNKLFRRLKMLGLILCLLPATGSAIPAENLKTGAEQTETYFPLLKDKKFALVVNQTSRIGGQNLVDSLCLAGLRPAFIFAPEHGFRGDEEAGAQIVDGTDARTGLKIHSLYGNSKKPSKELMAGLDVVVFDIQDVGCRFYTYLSTLHYVMEACADSDVKLIVLDRPNPKDCIDGPVRKGNCRSFVGMHPIPLLHGCTLGELAQMINGEHWANQKDCALQVVTVKGWQHGQAYALPVKPSPNLPNDHAICLYPSLCLFEGSVVSVGRGTSMPFEIIGYPDARFGDFQFKPVALKGFDTNPMYRDKVCYGIDLRKEACPEGFSLYWLIKMYRLSGMKKDFFKNARFFDLLAGDENLRQQILNGLSEEEIRQSWKKDLEAYGKLRNKYLLYP